MAVSYYHRVVLLFIFTIINSKLTSFLRRQNMLRFLRKYMKLRPFTQILLLIVAMQAVSGFKFRCWVFCTDQTSVQTDYVDARDSCRHYAQLRIETDTSNPELIDEKNRTAKLISLFSSCMADRGWTVPDGKSGQQAAAPIPVPTPGASTGNAPPPIVTAAPAASPAPQTVVANPAIVTAEEARMLNDQRRQKNYLARQSECAFARHGAAYSSVAATRAKACDIECAQHLKADPEGMRPAACLADPYETNARQ
jgi:hypothetical protein